MKFDSTELTGRIQVSYTKSCVCVCVFYPVRHSIHENHILRNNQVGKDGYLVSALLAEKYIKPNILPNFVTYVAPESVAFLGGQICRYYYSDSTAMFQRYCYQQPRRYSPGIPLPHSLLHAVTCPHQWTPSILTLHPATPFPWSFYWPSSTSSALEYSVVHSFSAILCK